LTPKTKDVADGAGQQSLASSGQTRPELSFQMSFHFTNVFSPGVCEMNEKKRRPVTI
jgi:hypothetical protein